MQSGVISNDQAIAFAERMLRTLSETHHLMGHTVAIRASIGIALAPKQGNNADELLKHADLALYHAKSLGRGTYVLFDPDYSYEKQSRRRLEADLRVALQERQLELFYQPIRDAKSHSVKSCEALMRWHHPQHGLVPPSDFIPLAEETGLIVAIGDWALRQACMDASTWPEAVGVTVNLSAAQFFSGDLYKAVETALCLSGVAPNRLELEITELVLLRDDASTIATLYRLRSKGVRIALDDFGTAFAFSQLPPQLSLRHHKN